MATPDTRDKVPGVQDNSVAKSILSLYTTLAIEVNGPHKEPRQLGTIAIGAPNMQEPVTEKDNALCPYCGKPVVDPQLKVHWACFIKHQAARERAYEDERRYAQRP